MFALFIGGIAWISYQSRKQPQQNGGEATHDQKISGKSEARGITSAITPEARTQVNGEDHSKHTTTTD